MRRRGGFGHMLFSGICVLFGISLFIAVMRAFGWDFFGVINWLWHLGSAVVLHIADWLSNSDVFKKVTAPGPQ